MNTTEIFVEQLLIGLLVISLGVSIVYGNPFEQRAKAVETAEADKPGRILINASIDKPDVVDKKAPIVIRAEVDNMTADGKPASTFDVADPVAEFIFGTLLLAVAYFVGIVYDRISDTLLQNFERHNRLMVIRKKLINKIENIKDEKKKMWAEKDEKKKEELKERINEINKTDPFPVHEIRLNMYRDEPAVSAHAAYLRSRIRVSRSIATLAPLFPLAFLMFTANIYKPWERMVIAFVIVLIYIVSLALKIFMIPKGPPKTDCAIEELCMYWENHLSIYEDCQNLHDKICHIHPNITSTKSCAAYSWVKNFFRIDLDPITNKPKYKQKCKDYKTKDDRIQLIWKDFLKEPLIICLFVFFILIGSLLIMHENFWLHLLCSIAILVMPFVSGWVWWRISETYNMFLLTYHEDSIENPKSQSGVWLSCPGAGNIP